MDYNSILDNHMNATYENLALFEVSREFADDLMEVYDRYLEENPTEEDEDSEYAGPSSLSETGAELVDKIRELYLKGKRILPE